MAPTLSGSRRMSSGGCFGRSRSLEMRTDDDGVNSFSSIDLRDSYVISACSMLSHGAIVWDTDS